MMTCVCVIAYLVSLWCSWDSGSASDDLRIDSAASRLVVGRGLSPLCSLACSAVALSFYIWVCPCGGVQFSSNGVYSLTPSSQRGAKYFRSLPTYLRGWHYWCNSCLA